MSFCEASSIGLRFMIMPFLSNVNSVPALPSCLGTVWQNSSAYLVAMNSVKVGGMGSVLLALVAVRTSAFVRASSAKMVVTCHSLYCYSLSPVLGVHPLEESCWCYPLVSRIDYGPHEAWHQCDARRRSQTQIDGVATLGVFRSPVLGSIFIEASLGQFV